MPKKYQPSSSRHLLYSPQFPPTLKQRLILFIPTTTLFIVGFIINITSNQALFNVNLNIVPSFQQGYTKSSSFTIFMNIISNIFNPVLCAGYVILFYLISYRKIEILGFLIWFIFLSFILSILKEAIHQPRPYWIANSQIQMFEWTCYTEYGCPSGHAMMGIILLQFIIRFFARVHKFVAKYIAFFYILALLFQGLVMLSRVFLGMHSLNQILFGFMIGLYSIFVYYLFIEKLIIGLCLSIVNTKSSMKVLLMIYATIFLAIGIEILITFVPAYDNVPYWEVIKNIEGCSNVMQARSFQYRCFQDSAIINALFGILFSLLVMERPYNLTKQLVYSRCSIKFVLKCIITIVCALIPVIIFLNPLWHKINTSTSSLAAILWADNIFGFFLGITGLVSAAAIFCRKLNFEMYHHPENYQEFKKFEVNTYLQEVDRVAQQQNRLNSHEESIDRSNSIEIEIK